jgi:CRISPR-associated protein (TIGR02710 family)
VVDFTGGTKCMSAAIALHARQWRCLYSYVGGSERTRDGIGVVVSGTEQIVHHANPWNALGSQALEHYIMLFDQLAFAAAARVAQDAKLRMIRDDRKSGLNTVEQLALGFESWERFDHKTATGAFRNVDKRSNDLRFVLGSSRADRVLCDLERFTATLDQIRNTAPPSRLHVLDLLANAWRRREEGRLDEAVARLYRAIEAQAQTLLRESHGIASTSSVPLDAIPLPLRNQWQPGANDASVKLGLQDAYTLLDALGGPLGKAFHHTGLAGAKSPLTRATLRSSRMASSASRPPASTSSGRQP